MGKVSNTDTIDWRAETAQLIRQNEERLKITELSLMLRANAENKLQIAEYRLQHDIPAPSGNP